ncbi:MAG: hypothetical protein QW144_03040 [Candidatus Micrarchaeaceae archaeon]
MTILGYYFHKKGYDVYSNYYTNFGKTLPMDIEEFVNFFENVDDNRKNLFLMDEIYVFIDSRVSSSIANRVYSSIILQTRKKSTNLIYTAQDPGSVDLRLRYITNYLLYPKINKKRDKMNIIVTDMNLDPKKIIAVNNVSRFFNMYNTKQIIKSEDLYGKIKKRK